MHVVGRVCADCDVDISKRGNPSRRCDDCQKVHSVLIRRKTRFGHTCADCGIDISNHAFHTKRCVACQKERKTAAKRKHPVTLNCVDCGADISLRPNAVRCVECVKELRRRDHRERMSNDLEYRERKRKLGREHVQRVSANLELAERRRQRERDWYANNPEAAQRKLQVNKAWRDNNPQYKEMRREYLRKRRATDPEYIRRRREYEQQRKPWNKTVNRESVASLLVNQKHRCARCRKSIRKGYHMDHIVPQSKGGESTLANLQILCPHCNMSKNGRIEYDWQTKLGI